LERDPEMVLRDLRNELVSPASARRDYGVVVAGTPPAIDWAATRQWRERLRARRNWRQPPAVSRDPAEDAIPAETREEAAE
jgi:N-methylhydantoinase B